MIFGGSDQWANILQGVDLVHKIDGKKVVGITTPLVLKSDGTKMGKTSDGAVWLDKDKTSVFDFFQFWRNLDDADVPMIAQRFLGLSINETIDERTGDFIVDCNALKLTIALEMVDLVHGSEERIEIHKSILDGTAANNITISIDEVDTIFDVLMKSGLFSTKGEVRRMIKHNENLVVNSVKIDEETKINNIVSVGDVFNIHKGKKHKVRVNIV